MPGLQHYPKIIMINWAILIISFSALRIVLKLYWNKKNPNRNLKEKCNIFIYGANEAGIAAYHALSTNHLKAFNVVGFIDDIHGLRARHKLLAQLVSATIMCLAGVRVGPINIFGIYSFNLGWFSFPVTILWIVAVTNAVNLIDGLDGLAAGISAIACGTIAIFSIASNQILMAVVMLAMLGSLCGFLIFNFNPARYLVTGE